MENRIAEMLAHRASVIELQQALEEAWRSAVSECLALNRRLNSSDLPESPEKRVLIEAESKRRRMEALQQNAFFVFQAITENKYEEQIAAGKKLIALPENCSPEELGAKTEAFLISENAINRDLLRKFSATRKSLVGLKEEAVAIRAMPCQPKKLGMHLDHDLGLLETFLNSTGDLLGLSPKKRE